MLGKSRRNTVETVSHECQDFVTPPSDACYTTLTRRR